MHSLRRYWVVLVPWSITLEPNVAWFFRKKADCRNANSIVIPTCLRYISGMMTERSRYDTVFFVILTVQLQTSIVWWYRWARPFLIAKSESTLNFASKKSLKLFEGQFVSGGGPVLSLILANGTPYAYKEGQSRGAREIILFLVSTCRVSSLAARRPSLSIQVFLCLVAQLEAVLAQLDSIQPVFLSM